MFLIRKKLNFLTIAIDVILIVVIIATGWFLIGYYLEGEYLAVTYQDWIYHAWRVQSIDEYKGMPSWDHIWSNGLNYWRAYQYLQHWLVLGVVKIFHLSFTKAMLSLTVAIFIGVRILIYVVLRLLKVRPIFAFLAGMISFAYVQQWIAISDFSIFIAFVVVPIYVYLWINVLNKYRLGRDVTMRSRIVAECILAIISGALWIVHPVVANALGGLFFISIGLRAIKISWGHFGKILIFYISGAIPFFLPYLMIDYRFSNPIFTTSGFMKETIAGDFFGLSMFFLFFIVVVWIMIIFLAKKVPLWSKTIMIYSSLYFLIIYLAQNEYIPVFIMQLQISRVVPILSLLMVFAFGGALNNMVSKTKSISRGVVIAVLLVSTLAISESIKISTAFTGQPTRTLDDPVSLYFNDKDIPRGSIYVKNVSAASFLGKRGLRFVTSYNEHLLPHPLSVRFAYFMRSEIAYTGVSASQIQLIRDYVTVLGIEYLILPEASPLVKNLTQESADEKGQTQFQLVDTMFVRDGVFSILHNTQPIANAYLFDATSEELQWKESTQVPNIQANSYVQWDAGVSSIAQKIRNEEAIPLDLDFVNTDELYIDLGDKSIEGKRMLITQSYDPYWYVNHQSDVIEPSQVRFMNVDIEKIIRDKSGEDQSNKNSISLRNKWPVWHWPLQALGVFLVLVLFIVVIIRPRLLFERPVK